MCLDRREACMPARLPIGFVTILIATQVSAFGFEEHRRISCSALERLCQRPIPAATRALLCTYHCGLRSEGSAPAVGTSPLHCIGLADLVGVSGDHTRAPEELLDLSCMELQRQALSTVRY